MPTNPTSTPASSILASWHTAPALKLAARKLRDEAVKGTTLIDPGQLLRLARTCEDAARKRIEMDADQREAKAAWDAFHFHQHTLERKQEPVSSEFPD